MTGWVQLLPFFDQAPLYNTINASMAMGRYKGPRIGKPCASAHRWQQAVPLERIRLPRR